MLFTFNCVVAIEKMDAGSPVKLSSNAQKGQECYNDVPLKEDKSCDDALLDKK